MSRRARLTVLELGASPTAWVASRREGTDDWIVVAQQSDEPASQFSERVRSRARRLRKEDTSIEAVDVYTAPDVDTRSALARRCVIEALGDQLATGGELTVWSDAACDAELSAILARFRPLLAERQVAMNHQACDHEEPSGIRHAIPQEPAMVFDEPSGFAFEE